jgi:hypothetical protein
MRRSVTATPQRKAGTLWWPAVDTMIGLLSFKCTGRAGDEVFLVRDPSNKYSRFAVEVLLAAGHQIGYVPETDVRELAPLLDSDRPYRAHIKKILTGGRAPIPVVVADVFRVEATVTGLRRRADAPTRIAAPTVQGKAGCAGAVAFVGATLGMASYFSR